MPEVRELFLFIFESIGMQELILIGAIALIVFGPRKLPQMMRMAGKMVAEFRKATNDFKETWEREVDFEDLKDDSPVKQAAPIENTIAAGKELKPAAITAPEIKELKQEEVEKIFAGKREEKAAAEQTVRATNGKQDWL